MLTPKVQIICELENLIQRNPSPKDIEQRAYADDYPQEQTLHEGLEAYGAEHVGRE